MNSLIPTAPSPARFLRFLHPLAPRSFRLPVVLALTCLAVVGSVPGGWAADADKPTGGQVAVKVFELKGSYEDHPVPAGFDVLSLVSGDLTKPSSFPVLCQKLDDTAEDKSVNHVMFDLSSSTLRMNLAQLAELDRHIQKLRKAGKKSFAWIEDATTVHYSVASSCDTILMADLGTVDLPSLSIMTMHFKDAMDLLGAKASFVRTGDFKGAVEPFTQSQMSPQLRAHYLEMMTSMNDSLVERVAERRGMTPARVRTLQAGRLYTSTSALSAKLVDGLAIYGGQRDAVARILGGEVRWLEPDKKKPKQLSFFELMGKLMGGATEPKAGEPAVAVLHLDGEISEGETDIPGSIVAGPTVKAIHELETESNIKAVVVRINSPGGSASASEAIRQALARLAARKPVVYSMGSMAASGGYWITCIGRPIHAEAGTLTGSIGVFGMKFSVGDLLRRVGVRIESVTLDESAGMMAMDRGWLPGEEARMQELVNEIYGKFLQIVATSRNLSVAKVDPIAGGRVWSGAQALKLKLVDRIGGLDSAVMAAAREAGLPEGAPVIQRPRQKSVFETLDLFGDLQDEVLGPLAPAVRALTSQTGFELKSVRHLLRAGLSGRCQQVWALVPAEIVIR